MRLYASAIAIVSGAYSVYLATTDEAMAAPLLMSALGVVVVVHGIGLLTPSASRIASVSGPLMVIYALLMLANQAWMELDGGGGDGDMPGMMDPPVDAMGWDPGMIALALLMLASGAIMTWRRSAMEPGESGM